MSQDMVVAVVVSYCPELEGLFRLCDALAVQADAVIIVDNGSPEEILAPLRRYVAGTGCLVEFGENLGIAAAQNRGVREAKRLGATHVILFDHDSQPAPDMLQRLLICCRRLQQTGKRVASVGPCYVDDRQDNPPPFIRVRGMRLTRILVPEDGDAVSVDYLIASGSLIPLIALDEVGGMDESLFIDFVDIEWGQRARSKGYENFGCFSACMEHSLGDDPIRFMGTAYPSRSPLRHYYLFRNAVRLYRMPHIPFDWKLADGMRAILRFGFYALFAKPRLEQSRMMLLGVWHGLIGRSGRLDSGR